MSSFNGFKREVNFTKNIFFFIFFIALVLTVYFQVVSSSIKEFRSINKDLQKSKTLLKSNDLYHDEVRTNIVVKKGKYSKSLKVSNNQFDAVSLSVLLSKYFSVYDISENVEYVEQDGYKYSDLTVKAQTSMPSNFYIFIDNLEFLNNVIELIYPIELESKEGSLHINFKLRYYVFYE